MAKKTRNQSKVFRENEGTPNLVNSRNSEELAVKAKEKTATKPVDESPESKAHIKAAWIAGIMLLIAGLISLFGVIYTSNKTSTDTVNSKKLEQEGKDKSDATKKRLASFDNAISSIQKVKDCISDINNKQGISYMEATNKLNESSKNLLDSYANFCTDVCGRCSPKCSFHKAKDEGRRALSFVQSQPPANQLSVEIKEYLIKSRKELSNLEDDISKLREDFNNNK